MIRILIGALMLSLAGCARNEAGSKSAEGSSQSATSAPVITLERTACFGSCPVYTISVSPSGEVHYEGRRHVRKLGVAIGKVPRDRVDALLSDLERGGYFTFAEQYTSGAPSCGRYAADAPTVISSVKVKGRIRQVTHDYGCSGAPGTLVILERKIDEALNSAQWTGR